jgi:hypothetical protein
MRRLILSALASAAIASAMVATPAHATITITQDQSLGQGENVLFTANQTGGGGLNGGPAVVGSTQSGFALNFTSTESIQTQANGQSRISATSGGLNNISIMSADSSLFDFIEFNAFGGGSFDGSLEVIATDQFGNTFTETFSEFMNGENFVFAFSDAEQDIASITINATGTGFVDLRQVRVGQATPMGAVPEPGTWAMMLLGFGGMGVAMRRRRRTGTMMTQMA